MNDAERFYLTLGEKRLYGFALLLIMAIVGLAIFQDYVQSLRKGNPFFFSESLLFKTFWFFFPPVLILLGHEFHKRKINTSIKLGAAILIPALVHLILTPLTVWAVSSIFREQSFGPVKVFTFMLSNDLLVIILIYTISVFLLRYSASKKQKLVPDRDPGLTRYLVINSGKNYVRINLDEILYIKSATPYVAIQAGEKQYLHSASLKSLGEQLSSRFIRVHKSAIVNVDKIISYKSRLNGDYDLVLEGGTEIRLSRNYVGDFRSKFGSSPQLKH